MELAYMKKLLAVLVSAGLLTATAFAQTSAPMQPAATPAVNAPAASMVDAPAPKAKSAHKASKAHNHHAKATKASGKKVAHKKSKKHKVAA